MARNRNLVPKVNGIYYVFNDKMKIYSDNGKRITHGGHNVIITSINKKNNTARVKTITSLVEKNNNKKFNNKRLEDVENGNILIIPNNILNSKVLSGVKHNTQIVKISDLKRSDRGFKFPKRYSKLIHRK